PANSKAEASLLGAKDLGSAAARNVVPKEKKRRSELAKKTFNNVFNTQKPAYRDLSADDKDKIEKEWNEFLKELNSSSDAVDIITPDYVEDNMKKHFLNRLNGLVLSIEAEDYVKKVCEDNKNNQNKSDWVEFLNKKENKTWEDILEKARMKIIYPGKTKAEYEAANPTIELDDSFPFDLGERIDMYLKYADDHVDAFHEDEKITFRKVIAAATAIITDNLPLQSVVLEGITYGIVEPKIKSTINAAKKQPAKKTKNETDAEKEERMKFSRAGAQITLQRVDKWKDLKVDLSEKGENKGDKNFIKLTRKLWKEFAVHGRLEKNLDTGKFDILKYSDLDGKCCVELLRMARIDTANLEFVAPGSFKEGKINMDTGGKHGVIAEDFDKKDAKTAYIDHHGENSPSNSSASAIMYKTLVDLGLLKKSDQLDKMIGFVTDIDSGIYPEIDKYFENSWKTLYGMQRFIQGENLVQFFQRNTDSNLNRELTEAELESCGLILKDKSGKIFDNKCEKQEKVAKKSKESLEKMEKDGFIITSVRYRKIAVSVESGIPKDKTVPGGFLAARAFGCDTYISWNPKENKFNISAKVPITEKYPQGLNVREIMWVKNDGDDSELTVTLGEILNKMTDGKLVATGELKAYLEKEAQSKTEPKKNSAEQEKAKKAEEKKLKAEKAKNEKERIEKLYQESTNDFIKTKFLNNLSEFYVKIRKLSDDEKEIKEEMILRIGEGLKKYNPEAADDAVVAEYIYSIIKKEAK
ncbi:MAG: hypothetical protein PHP62_02535, partial [Candidatus Moranbacteria bacterium]|nr:hypothetical protein [Candidatus Moranbacteria bacterium]